MVDFVASVCRYYMCEGEQAIAPDCIVKVAMLKVNPMPSLSVHYVVFSVFLIIVTWNLLGERISSPL